MSGHFPILDRAVAPVETTCLYFANVLPDENARCPRSLETDITSEQDLGGVLGRTLYAHRAGVR